MRQARLARVLPRNGPVEVVAGEIKAKEAREEVDGRWDVTEEVVSVVGG